jgi:predicted  nucleic acid-binding Zn-ribbon protein
MTDRSKQDVADDLQQWHDYERRIATLQRVVDTQEDYIRDLLDDDTSNDQIIRLVAQERNDLRADVDDLRAELAGTAMRLRHSEERTEWLRKRLSRTDLWAALVLAWWKVARGA